MDKLWLLFPPDNFVLLGLVLALPLLGAFINGVFGKRLGKEAVTLVGLLAVGVPFLLSSVAFAMLHAAQTDKAARFVWHAWQWLTLSTRQEKPAVIDVAFSIDALSGTMALVVTGVGFLIHLYSTKYMEADPGYHRFFAYLNLFVFSMLVLILGDNLPVLFVGWEGVGLCSYLLIGFWFKEEKNAQAGKKAFITNRIGDFGLLVAMGLIFYYIGALDWASIEVGRTELLRPHQVWPLVGDELWFANHLPEAVARWLNEPRYVNAATLVGLALFLGCAGKSAQIPLYVWLPDAMAGPTPVSALIHAATMVTAGVYLMCRMAGVFVLSPAAMMTVAVIGAVTAVLAATIAFAQRDIKKVLAYSTVSQLGFMFMATGVGAFAAGFFHVLTHAFFKACLFLGAGSVIHAMHARIHDSEASQDMVNMGGLKRFMPITFWTFVASWAAIVGLPLTSGFFSKDEILFKTFTSYIASPGAVVGPSGSVDPMAWERGVSLFVFVLAVLGAVMTAFYMTRLLVGVFFGEFRGWAIVPGYKASHLEHGDEHHGDEHHGALDHGSTHAHEKGPIEGPEPHESPWQMTLPLVVLATLAVFGGALNAHAVFHSHWLDDWLAPVFAAASPAVASIEGAEGLMNVLLVPGILAFFVGVGGAYWVFVMRSGEPARSFKERFPRLYQLVFDKWRIDELYQETVLGAVDTLAELSVWLDKYVVDGIVARLTAGVVALAGFVLRQFQTGRVQAYAFSMVVGLAAVGWFFIKPHAEFGPPADGTQRLVAAPGFGYKYRWDTNGDGDWDSEGRTISVPGAGHSVRLEVENVFGRVAVRERQLADVFPQRTAARGRAPSLQVEVRP
jgi:NADH-quinone oxidoreductase subunit L